MASSFEKLASASESEAGVIIVMHNTAGHTSNQPRLQLFTKFLSHAFIIGMLGAGTFTTTSCSNPGAKNDAELNARSSKVEYDSNQLMMKSADEIAEIVRKKIKKAQSIQANAYRSDDQLPGTNPEAVNQLKDAMRIVLGRPDEDGTRDSAFSGLRRELQDMNAVNQVLSDLAHEGIEAIASKTTGSRRQATYLVLLEGLMSEIRPEAQTNDAFKKIIFEIRDANLKLTDALKSQALLNSMVKPVSPSVTAKDIIAKDFSDKKKR